MQIKIKTARLTICLLILALLALAGPARAGEQSTLYQYSTIDALMEGVYDGGINFANVAAQGGFGIGTVNKLDGELIGLDGAFYQITHDGKVHKVFSEMKTPFVDVTVFSRDIVAELKAPVDLKGLEQFISSHLPSPNLFYAIRIDAAFTAVKARSVPKATKRPYPKLVEMVKRQNVFDFEDIKGTLAGFYSPAYVKGVGVPGYHVHFINDARDKGGHVLDLKLAKAKVQIMTIPRLKLQLPTSGDFLTTALGDDKSGQLKTVEKGQ